MWVVARYEGRRAHYVQGLADEGIGYFVLETNNNSRSLSLLVVFRYYGEQPLPHHLEEVRDPTKLAYYEKIYKERHGIVDRPWLDEENMMEEL